MRATATRRFSAGRIEIRRPWFNSKGFEMPLEVFWVERKIEEGQPESQNQTRGRKNQSSDGKTAAFVKFGMPVDLRQPDEREDQSEDVKRTSAAAAEARQRQKAENQPCRCKGIGFGQLARRCSPRLQRPDHRRNWQREMSRKFRQHAERFPFRCAGSERCRLRVGAAFGHPLPQLPGGCRTVFSAVRSNDFIHTRLSTHPRFPRPHNRRPCTRRVLPPPQSPARLSPPGW